MEFKLEQLKKTLTVSKIASVHFFELDTAYQTQDASHPFHELIFSHTGTLQILSDNYQGELKRGELIIHQSNEVHSLATQRNKKNTVITIGFQCASPFLKFFSKQKILLNEAERKQLTRIVTEGRNVYSPPYDKPIFHMEKRTDQVFGCEQLLQALLECFLIELIRRHQRDALKYDVELPHNLPMEAIVEYVDGHFANRLTIDELALLFNTNRSVFCRAFKAYTGKTLITYIADKKLESIKELLTSSRKSLVEISDELHFDNPAYLCRFFKKHTGVTPITYRNTQREALPVA
jgi:AraC-like DNA-binding protein